MRAQDDQTLHCSDLQIAIIRGLAVGMQTKDLCTHLNRKGPTIETHIRVLYAKLGARSRAHLVARAIALNIIFLPVENRSYSEG